MEFKECNLEKLEFIENFFFDHCERVEYVYIVLHSLFNCISDNELCQLYFYNSKGDHSLKNSIESYIAKKATNNSKRNFEKIALSLLSQYNEQDSKSQTAIRKFLFKFIRTLNKKTVLIYFNTLIGSDRKYDRHSANQVADIIWNDEIEGILIDNFYKYEDEYSLMPLVQNLNDKELCRIIQNYLTPNFPSRRLKKTIIEKISNLSVKKLSFLVNNDPLLYIQLLNEKKFKITECEIKKILPNINDDFKYYLIWTIGLTGDWELTYKYLNKILLNDSD